MTSTPRSASPLDPSLQAGDAASSAGLLRRLGAAAYDAFLLIAVLMLTTALLLPLSGGKAITPQSAGGLAYAYRILLLAVVIAYFGVCWTRTGQTLGMLAWKIRVVRADGNSLRWCDVFIRFASALLAWLPGGLGVLWMAVDRERLAWHDRLSGTRVVRSELHPFLISSPRS